MVGSLPEEGAPEQRVGRGLHDLDGHEAPRRLGLGCKLGGREVDHAVVGVAALELPLAFPARALEEHLRGGAHPRAVGGQGEPPLELLEALEAVLGLRLGDAARELGGRGARPRRVLEGVAVDEGEVADEAEGRLEVLLASRPGSPR